MGATLAYHKKVTVIHGRTLEVGVCELKVWRVPESAHYEDGIKYSLFLVLKGSGKVKVGLDNHKQKGPHLHRNDKEVVYHPKGGADGLVDDFWQMVREEGFEL